MVEPTPAPRIPRRRVDLVRALSPLARTLLALAVVVVVAGLAWWSGHNDPVPAWVTKKLVPALGWIWLGLAAVALVSRLRDALQRRQGAASDPAGAPRPPETPP